MSQLFAPETGSRWMHRLCKRVAVVLSSTSKTVSYRYELTAGMPPGRVRRGRHHQAIQTVSIDAWRGAFTMRAPEPKKRGAR